MVILPVLLYGLVGLLLVLFLRFKWKMRRMEYYASKLAGPPCLPVLGNILDFLDLNDTNEILRRINALNRYGKVVRVWYGYHLYILVNDPNIVQSLLTSPDAVEKGIVYKFFAGNLGGVFMASRDNWHTMRKSLNLTFNPKRMEEYLHVFNKHSLVLMEILQQHENKMYDPQPQMARCLIDIIIETHFGVKTNEQQMNRGRVFESMVSALEHTYLRSSKLWLYPDFIYKKTSYYQDARRVKAVTSLFFQEVIEESLKRNKTEYEGSENGKQKNLYIDMIVEWIRGKGIETNPHSLRCLICDIIIAGYDTTSTTICHLLYNLAAYPEVQAKIHAELDEVLINNMDGPIEKQDFFQMTYLEMAMKETLRKFAPPFVVRTLHHDLKTEYGVLPAGCSPYINIQALHKDPDYWEYPDKFYPEHFLPEAVAARPKYSYIPFSAGPRNCPGMLYANWATKVIAATILRKYRVETDVAPENIKYKFLLMLEPVKGFSLKFIPRT